jgi:hypothetical protein
MFTFGKEISGATAPLQIEWKIYVEWHLRVAFDTKSYLQYMHRERFHC